MPPRTHITIRDIAEQLGISHSTVSRSLRDSPLIRSAMKERVRAAAQELGYVADSAARSMRGEPSNLIGFVLPDVRPDFFSALTTAVSRIAAVRGYHLMLAVSQHDAGIEEAQIRALREARVAGVLVYPTADLTVGSVRLLKAVPTVQVARLHPRLQTPFVGTDDAPSMTILVQHLISLGHERIGFIGSDPRFPPGLDRLNAFRQAMERFGRPVDEALVRTGMATAQSGADAAKSLLEASTRPTAVAVASAPMAEGVLDVFQRRGVRIPEEMSLTSFGDPFWYRSWGAGITTVVMPVEGIAETALGLLLNRPLAAGEGNTDSVIKIPTDVVLRRTTMAPRA